MNSNIGLILGLSLLAATSGAQAEGASRAKVHATMDAVFGPSRWRETGGYRTQARENELRAQGALTVPVGVVSRHSMGTPDAPGAYDLVVHGMDPWRAAERLRQAGAPFQTIFPEGAHGSQGAHLHVVPGTPGSGAARGAARRPGLAWTVSDPSPAQQVFNSLHDAAAAGDAGAQLRLGELYAEGRLEKPDRFAAYVWIGLAGSNPAADAATRETAGRRLAALARIMRPADVREAQRFIPTGQGGSTNAANACNTPPSLGGGVQLLLVGTYEPTPAANQGGCVVR